MGRSRSGAARVSTFKEPTMDRPKEEDLPHRDQSEIEAEAEKNRKEQDSVPPHGTDPLHEGP
jgi:hypothetical protein